MSAPQRVKAHEGSAAWLANCWLLARLSGLATLFAAGSFIAAWVAIESGGVDSLLAALGCKFEFMPVCSDTSIDAVATAGVLWLLSSLFIGPIIIAVAGLIFSGSVIVIAMLSLWSR